MLRNIHIHLIASLAVCATVLPLAMGITVKMYFTEVKGDLTKITWAHAVNTHQLLLETLADPKIMFIEADVLMGTHGEFRELVPVIAHPPANHSDLTLLQFLNAVVGSIKDGRRVGIKLDFKDINAVEPSLKYLRTRRDSVDTPEFPIIINADILPGPVSATKKPVDAQRFITLVKTYTPFAVLSVGWTTRYGMDDPLDEIREGQYTKDQMKEMLKVLRKYAGENEFQEITIPVRASLAAQSIDDLASYFIGRIYSSEPSLTLWSPKTDSVNKQKLQELIQETGTNRCFLDLPPEILGNEEESSGSTSGSDEASQRTIRHPSHQNLHRGQQPSQMGQLEGRGENEQEHHHHRHGKDVSVSNAPPSRRIMSLSNVFPVLAAGIVAAFIFNNRR